MKKIFLLLVAAFFLQSCIFIVGPIVKGKLTRKLTVENKAIPPDLGFDDAYVVCIMHEKNSRDRYVKKHFKKFYKGNMVFVTAKELESESYSDAAKYRYIFDYMRHNGSVQVVQATPTGNQISNVSTPSSNYFIHDRLTNIEYNSRISTGWFGKYIKAYSQNLEKKRLAAKKG